MKLLNWLPTVTEMLPGVPPAMSGLINNLMFSTWLGSRASSAEIWVLVSKNSAVISRVTPNDLPTRIIIPGVDEAAEAQGSLPAANPSSTTQVAYFGGMGLSSVLKSKTRNL